VTLQDAARIARDGLAEVFGIKLNRVGGLTKAARMRDIALAHGIDMFVMATGGSVLADTEALHLAATIPDAHCLPRGLGLSGHDHRRHRGRAGPAQYRRPPAPARGARAWACIPTRRRSAPPWRSYEAAHDVMESPALMPVAQRITRLRLWHVPLTSHATYYMAEGKTCATVTPRWSRWRPTPGSPAGARSARSRLPARLCRAA
jgi:hypothetical protein